jgi:hypothetical protein
MASSVKVDTGKSQLLQPDLVLARHTIHTVDDNRVPFPRVLKQGLQLGALNILPGCLVGEDAVGIEMFQLPLRVLLIAADPDIPDALTLRRHETSLSVRKGL